MYIRVSGFIKESVVDGPGLRAVLFTQGCPHRCPGCHNPQTHDADGGYDLAIGEFVKEVRQNKLLRGVTFSGGEPLLQPSALLSLAQEMKAMGKDIMLYTGFTFEQILQMAEQEPAIYKLLQYIDILVDGPYIEAQRDLRLLFRGSKNQRLIDVPKALSLRRVIMWNYQERILA